MTIDWPACDQRLHTASVAAIRRLARECHDEPISFFAFDSEPRYGYVQISFDTLTGNIRSAKRREEFAIEQRQKVLTRPDAWMSAKYFLRSPVLTAFNTNSGNFAFSHYSEVRFSEWRKLAEEGGYPVGDTHQDDYLESNARLVLWRVAEQLVAEEAFKPLTLASPFLVGYGIHDQEEVVLRLLNWPASAVQGAPADRPREHGSS
jgi:hypothetical protein